MYSVARSLHEEALDPLRRLSRLRETVFVCVSHREKLVRPGLAAIKTGTLMITRVGRAKRVLETTRASWLLEAA